jgi:hypothetical protein
MTSSCNVSKGLLLILALFISSCHKRPNITIYDTSFEILNGKVKQLTDTYKNFNGIETHITSFDKQGNATQMQKIGGYCDRCTLTFSYKYDKNGKKTEVIMAARERQQPYKCYTNGRIVEERFNTKDYDFDKNDWAKRKEVFRYDDKDDMIELKSYDDSVHFSKTTYKHNESHFLTETNEFSENGTLVIKVIYDYPLVDQHGNWVKEIIKIEHRLVENAHEKRTITKDTIIRKISYY